MYLFVLEIYKIQNPEFKIHNYVISKFIIDIDLCHFILENWLFLCHKLCHNYYSKSIIDIDLCNFILENQVILCH